jgi:phenylacetic acid degradation operon negative regulatory protein
LTPSSTATPVDLVGQPAPKTMILDIYGAYIRSLGGWLAVAHLLVLMADLGHDGPAVRAAISRMKRSGLLCADTRGGVAGYALTPAAAEILRDGDARIFHSAFPTSLSDGWVIAAFSVPEQARERRHRLRSQLIQLGFGQMTPGVWIAPRRMHVELGRLLARSELTQHVSIFGGAYLGFSDLGTVVARAWDLRALERRYRSFIALHGRTARPGRQRQRTDRQAFAYHMNAIAAWRCLAYLDPGLPAELLPQGWCGERARSLFTQLHEQLERPAQSHVMSVINNPTSRDTDPPKAA